MKDLITLSPVDQKLDRNLMTQPGAFLWWYADMLDGQGNGAVFIWSFGLPFLPGIAHDARQGKPQQPGQRPSLNISIYKNHKIDFYALQEFDPDEVSWEDDGTQQRWRFGQHEIIRRMNAQSIDLMIRLSGKVPGTKNRLKGQFTLSGLRRKDLPTHGKPLDHNHDWTPLMSPCTATLNATCGGVDYQITGRGYHDRNSGQAPLHDLGFSHWIWGRVPLHQKELIYYVLWPNNTRRQPVTLGLVIDHDGTTHRIENLTAKIKQPKLSLAGGLLWHQHIELYQGQDKWIDVEVERVMDEGPFYLRYFTQVSFEGERAMGIGEFCRPNMVDRQIFKPLVNMRIGQPQSEKDSMWIPLFTGPKRGRVRRLLTHNLLGKSRS